jgi:hypothetical protein
MARKWREISMIVVAQYFSALLGWCWGLALLRRDAPWWRLLTLFDWKVTGVAAGVAFLVEAGRTEGHPGRERARRCTRSSCFALGVFVFVVMLLDPFVNCQDNGSLVAGLLLVVPTLLAIGALARSKAWLALAAAILFFATCVAMIVVNRNSGAARGFFYRECP